MNWQPINTAPKSTPILTNCGLAIFETRWNYPQGRWYECDFFGNIYDCADNGEYRCEPKIWQPLPELPKEFSPFN